MTVQAEQIIDDFQVSPQIAQLLANALADGFLLWFALLSDGQILFSGFSAIGAWFLGKAELGMIQGINDMFAFFPSFIE